MFEFFDEYRISSWIDRGTIREISSRVVFVSRKAVAQVLLAGAVVSVPAFAAPANVACPPGAAISSAEELAMSGQSGIDQAVAKHVQALDDMMVEQMRLMDANEEPQFDDEILAAARDAITAIDARNQLKH